MTIERQWETDIAASAEDVFALLADLRHYDRWLPGSSAYRGTADITEGPIREGTAYTEPGPFGTRVGRVTTFMPPVQLDFEQPMTMRPRFAGTIGIRLFHTLTPHDGGVHLLRRLELSPQGPVRLASPLLVREFTAENVRMLGALKRYAERRAAAPRV